MFRVRTQKGPFLEGTIVRREAQRGEQTQAIARSRVGQTTKIHTLIDPRGRPLPFLLIGGEVADCTAADRLFEQMPATDLLYCDKGYDSAPVRQKIGEVGTAPDNPATRYDRSAINLMVTVHITALVAYWS